MCLQKLFARCFECFIHSKCLIAIGRWYSCCMAKKQAKIKKVMREFKGGKLHSGSKKGPMVTNRKQAVAIALSEARKKAGY